MNADMVGDPEAAVRKKLEAIAPCETGYPGVSWCKECAGCRSCADALDRALTQEFPSIQWAPTIRQVLGLW